jgi:hypothetical protein
MILNLTPFAWIHTILSLVALVAGTVVIAELLASRTPPLSTALYLAAAVATSVTGFFFRGVPFGLAHWIGVISLAALLPAVLALYRFDLVGAWRWIYVVGVVIGFYFLLFVTIAQAFRKVLVLTALAPTQSEPPFAVTQLVALAVVVLLAVAALIRFRPPKPIEA